MKIFDSKLNLTSKGFCHIQDITPHLRAFLEESGVSRGLVTVMVPGSTAGITTIEYESGVINDLKRAIEKIAPQDMEYEHNLRWGDGNGFSHVRAALMKPSLSIPISNGELCLGTWQQVVFLDFDNRGRNRKLHIQIMGE
jgi:secondary thiamine-phosphate synthase enzyme